ALPWPGGSGYHSLRLFVAMTPMGHVATAPFLSEEDSVRVGFRRLLEAIEEDPAASDESLHQELTAANVEPAVAQRLIAFVPHAFAEHVLKEATHSPAYELALDGGGYKTRALASEPTYVVARAAAAETESARASAFRALARRSATMNIAE